MGLPMMDSMHAPTVTSGPRSGETEQNARTTEDTPLMDLITEKERVERELKALGSVLDSVGTLQASIVLFY